MQNNQLYDTFGRMHDYLRISLTDACNLRCMYCMPNEKVLVTPSAKLMQADEIETIAKTFINLGVKKHDTSKAAEHQGNTHVFKLL